MMQTLQHLLMEDVVLRFIYANNLAADTLRTSTDKLSDAASPTLTISK